MRIVPNLLKLSVPSLHKLRRMIAVPGKPDMLPDSFIPREPESLEETGLAPSTIEQLIFKILYFRGDVFGQDLSTAVGLKFSIIEPFVEHFKLSHHIQVKRSLGMGTVGAMLSLTESGRERAREHL